MRVKKRTLKSLALVILASPIYLALLIASLEVLR
ncbi:hypothetical protein HALO32_02585 [Halomonas lysinitropha]|uniref:Uncharacterized protein n=1 Tax=Halomonas lysinitropha TaxID=2607506 RepID=A0A5K1I4U8_9GAMM|nr:hypothetical protein HALO32_02585 [Halomonas lysinitropha]